MKHWFVARKLVLVVAASLVFCLGRLLGDARANDLVAKPQSEFVPGEIIVKFEDSLAQKIRSSGTNFLVSETLDELSKKAPISEITPVFGKLNSLNSIYKIKLTGNWDAPLVLARQLGKRKDIVWAEPNYIARAYEIIPNDPLFPRQWGLTKIQAREAWNYIDSNLSPLTQFLDQSYTFGSQSLNLTSAYSSKVSQNIIPNSNGMLSKVEIELGSWGRGTYDVYASINNLDGNSIAETSVRVGPSGQKPGWITFNFSAKPLVNKGETYQLLLRQSISWSSFFWKYDPKSNTKNYRLYLSKKENPFSQTIIAVVDTGIDSSHEDLVGKVLPGKNFVDPDHPTDDTSDVYGHGTHVSGIMAAHFNNLLGISGLSRENGQDSRIKILPVKGLGDEGYGTFTSLSASLLYAASQNAKVINASWGAAIYSQLIKETIAYIYKNYDCQIVAAAGNNMSDLDVVPHSPAGYEEVITVGASDQNDYLSVWNTQAGSNWGFRMDLVSPGTSIVSLLPGDRYESWNGTSMATPQVTVTYAIIKAIHPSWTKEQIKKVISLSANDLGEPGKDKIFSFGRLNLLNSLKIKDPNSLPLAKINSPQDGEIIYNNQTKLNGLAYGQNFKEYRVSVKAASASEWKLIFRSGRPVSTTGDLSPVIDLSEYKGNWIYFKVETFSQSSPGYDADIKRLFVNSAKGWSKKFSPTSVTSPAIGDVNNDGFLEILVTGGNSYPIEKETVHLFGWNGEYLSGWPISVDTFVQGFHPLILQKEEGESKIILNGYQEMLVLNNDGTAVEGWPLRNLEVLTRPAVADINNDGKKEVIFFNEPGQTFYTEVKAYSLEDNDKDGLADPLVDWQNPIVHIYHPSYPVVADINNDSYQEIIFTGTDENQRLNAFAFNHRGEVVGGWPLVFEEETWEKYQPIVADLNNDGSYEIVFTLLNKAYAYELGADGTPKILDNWPITRSNGYFLSPPIAADVDGNGTTEIVFQEFDLSRVKEVVNVVDSKDQTIKRVELPSGEWFHQTMGEDGGLITADLNGDGNLEILAILDTLSPYGRSTLEIAIWSLYPEIRQTEQIFLPGETARSSIIVGDLDKNNYFDILVNTWQDGRLNVFEYPTAYSSTTNTMPWPTFNHDQQNTRNYNFQAVLKPIPTPIIIQTPTPTFVPTPSPTPALCPLIISQEKGAAQLTFNDQWEYAAFTVPATGVVDKIAIKAGNWGGAQRKVSCKVTDDTGFQDISVQMESQAFTNSSGASWREIDFKANPFNLQKDIQYRLYCKGPDSWGSLYWIYGQEVSSSKTYRVSICPNP